MITLVRPSNGPLTQMFGNIQPDGNPHTGEDYGYTANGNVFPDVFAAHDGIVEWAGDSRKLGWPNPYYLNPDFNKTDAQDSSAGNVLVLRHEATGILTTYSHLESWNVRTGQRVKARARVAIKGNTGFSFGRHLHFEVIPPPFNFNTPTYGRIRPIYTATKGWLMALNDEQQQDLYDWVQAIYLNTSDISRGSQKIQLNQEVADIKTMLLKAGHKLK